MIQLYLDIWCHYVIFTFIRLFDLILIHYVLWQIVKDLQSLEQITEPKFLAPYGVQAKLCIYKFGIWMLRNPDRNFGYPDAFLGFPQSLRWILWILTRLAYARLKKKREREKSLIISGSVQCDLTHKITTENWRVWATSRSWEIQRAFLLLLQVLMLSVRGSSVVTLYLRTDSCRLVAVVLMSMQVS